MEDVGLRVQEYGAQHSGQAAEQHAQAKRYNRIKLIISVFEVLLFFLLALAVVSTPISRTFSSIAHTFTANEYLALLLYVALFGIAEALLMFPISFYCGFLLEHHYNLSNQTFGRWLWERVKGALVTIPIVVPLLLVFFYFLRNYGDWWWIAVGVVMIFFSVLFARLAPILILPLFYQFKPLEENSLKQKLIQLCRDVEMNVEGMFSFNMSKNTKKANAGFTGIGKSKRIIIGDTLLENFTEEEIETVFAHELGHYTYKHIWKSVIVGAVNVLLGLFITAELYKRSLLVFGFERVDDIAALPLLSLWLGIFALVMSPISNAISRFHERQADRFAVMKTNKPDAFVSALRKLANMNLVDTAPHPIVEFLFYSHPSIEKRIRMMENK